jgi:hypothetical protein
LTPRTPSFQGFRVQDGHGRLHQGAKLVCCFLVGLLLKLILIRPSNSGSTVRAGMSINP